MLPREFGGTHADFQKRPNRRQFRIRQKPHPNLAESLSQLRPLRIRDGDKGLVFVAMQNHVISLNPGAAVERGDHGTGDEPAEDQSVNMQV